VVEGRRAAVRTTAEDVASAGEIQRAEEEIGGVIPSMLTS